MTKFFRTLLAFIAILAFASAAFSPRVIFAEGEVNDPSATEVTPPEVVVEEVINEVVDEAVNEVVDASTTPLLLSNTQTDVMGGTTLFPKVFITDSTQTGRFVWDVLKTGPTGPVKLALGQSMMLDYSVVVTATDVGQTAGVNGRLEMMNTGTEATQDLTVVFQVQADTGSGFSNVAGASQTVMPAQIPATYSSPPILFSIPFTPVTGATYRVSALVTITNYVGYLGSPHGLEVFASFGLPTATLSDDCVTVSDSLFGSLGTVCAGASPATFNYSVTVGPYDVCGDYQVTNVATIVTDDSLTTKTSQVTTDLKVPCEPTKTTTNTPTNTPTDTPTNTPTNTPTKTPTNTPTPTPTLVGCTLTPGYWKTHSSFGPAPYDPTWALVGENTTFFLSGKSYYQVLWTNPSGGNAYYILAHAFIAAQMNGLTGATPPSAEMSNATTFFNTYTPTATLTRAVRNQAIAWAGVLDAFNNGLVSYAHCN